MQIPDTIPPTDLENLHVTARDSQQITVVWNPSTDNVGVTEYVIYHEERVVATTSETSYTFTGISLDNFYLIRVSARDQAGNESYSREIISITDSPVS